MMRCDIMALREVFIAPVEPSMTMWLFGVTVTLLFFGMLAWQRRTKYAEE
jgi:hypothetical protein